MPHRGAELLPWSQAPAAALAAAPAAPKWQGFGSRDLLVGAALACPLVAERWGAAGWTGGLLAVCACLLATPPSSR